MSLPLITIDICNFIAFLFEKRYSSGSNVSHISALGYVHQILNMPSEIQDVQWFAAALIFFNIHEGCYKRSVSTFSVLS